MWFVGAFLGIFLISQFVGWQMIRINKCFWRDLDPASGKPLNLGSSFMQDIQICQSHLFGGHVHVSLCTYKPVEMRFMT